jgi:hypothetical protein
VKASSLQIALSTKTPIIFQISMKGISMNFIKAAQEIGRRFHCGARSIVIPPEKRLIINGLL